MNLFKKLFKKNTAITQKKTESNRIVDENNPAFDYVQQNYEINCSNYRKLADTIYEHSNTAASEFAKMIGKRKNDDLVHFFFDYFLATYITTKPENFHHKNKDAFSAIIDGIHGEYYGNVSNEIIHSQLELWVTENKCFFKSCLEGKSVLMINIASFCAGKESIGATEILGLAEPFKSILNSKVSSINTFYDNL